MSNLIWGTTPNGGCATLQYFDDDGKLDDELELWELNDTPYLHNIYDSVAFNKQGEYLGEFFPFGNILNPHYNNTNLSMLDSIVDDFRKITL